MTAVVRVVAVFLLLVARRTLRDALLHPVDRDRDLRDVRVHVRRGGVPRDLLDACLDVLHARVETLGPARRRVRHGRRFFILERPTLDLNLYRIHGLHRKKGVVGTDATGSPLVVLELR